MASFQKHVHPQPFSSPFPNSPAAFAYSHLPTPCLYALPNNIQQHSQHSPHPSNQYNSHPLASSSPAYLSAPSIYNNQTSPYDYHARVNSTCSSSGYSSFNSSYASSPASAYGSANVYPRAMINNNPITYPLQVRISSVT